MTLRRVHVVVDADDADALRDFWIDALGYVKFDEFEQYRLAVPAGGATGPKFVFQKAPERRSPGKNRLHIDVEVGDDLHAECERLIALGAARVSDEIVDVGNRWIVMADPEGNEFCLVHH